MAVMEMDNERFEKDVLESEKPVIVDFYADWCGPCQMMKPVFEELSNDFGGKVDFAKVNTDQNQDLANKFNIRGIPCLVIFKEGKEIDRIVGFSAKDALKEKIAQLG